MAGEKFPESYKQDGYQLVCHYPNKISSGGMFTHENPLNYASPLLLLELSLCFLTSLLIDYCIRPLGQTTLVSQIFGGIVLGPSLLGHEAVLGPLLFPPRGRIPFITFSTFGIMFFLFLAGVQMDGKMIFCPGWRHSILGASPMLANLVFTVPVAVIMTHHISMDKTVANALPVIAAAQSITSFTNISIVLRELKLLQSDLGRLATSSAMICEGIGYVLFAVAVAILPTPGENPLMVVGSLGCSVAFVIVLVFLVRPLTLRVLRRLPEGKPVGELYIVVVFVLVLVCGVVSEVIGQHFVLGPMVLGVVMPEGPPLGSALTAKLEIPVGKLLYPSFLTTSGLKTNIFTIRFKSFWSVTLVIFLSCVVKTGAVMFSASHMDIVLKDSFVLGLLFNAKGVMELILYNLLMDGEVLNAEGFTLCVLSVIAVTAVITPLIQFFYDPNKQIIPMKRRTIQHAKRDSEIRILVCIHDQEEVPSLVDLLEASHATQDSPLGVIALLLVKLVGRAAPMLIAHQSHRNLQSTSFKSGRIFNALRQYELCNQTCVTTRCFSSISEFDTMHEDICRVGVDHNTNIIILPFHKHWEIDGSITSVNRAVQILNTAVLGKAPCSVAILVNRRVARTKGSILNGFAYHVAVIYIGGADDAEALYYGNRMAGHPNVTLTLIRYLLLGSDTARSRKLDNDLIDDVRRNNMANKRFVCQEELVKDSVGLAASVRGLGNSFNLIVVGMHHPDSPLLVGLATWIECPELGVIGDMLAEPDVKRSASLLVVQQQRVRGKLITRGMKHVIADQE